MVGANAITAGQAPYITFQPPPTSQPLKAPKAVPLKTCGSGGTKFDQAWSIDRLLLAIGTRVTGGACIELHRATDALRAASAWASR